MQNIHIKSWLKVEQNFVEIENFQSQIEDSDYIYGAIDLIVDDQELLNKAMWDLVDQLWYYLALGLIEISDGNNFSTHFPDQAILMEFKHVNNNYILISVKAKKLYHGFVEKREFLKCMSQAGIHFFELMEKIVPENVDMYREAIEQLEKIKIVD